MTEESQQGTDQNKSEQTPPEKFSKRAAEGDASQVAEGQAIVGRRPTTEGGGDSGASGDSGSSGSSSDND